MRDDYPRRGRTALMWLMSAVTAGFILVAVFERMFDSDTFTQWFQLSFSSVRQGYAWQLFTYPFVHPLEGALSVLQVALNLLCLYFLGREMETLLGWRRFLILYFGAVLLAAGCWLAVNFNHGGELAGTWPAILACLTMYALLYPDQEMSVLILFIPVTLRPKYIAWGLLMINLLAFAFWELRGQSLPVHYAPSAHLGGMLAGALYFFLVHRREWRNPDGRTVIELPRWMRKARKNPAVVPGKYKVNLTTPPQENLKSEVDRILDKINSHGFSSLTSEEKSLLDTARNQLGRNS
ncbi:MAG: rhomboid family intramembrane serine protease [Nibricoccus sp.]